MTISAGGTAHVTSARAYMQGYQTSTYRVRYSATGMDRARRRDTLLAGEPLLDRYLLQLWPAPPAPDSVIRETSRCAAYWHAHARTLPSPRTRGKPNN